MIIACTHCAAQLQLEDAKVPSCPFTVRCPKCQQIINAQPPVAATEINAMAVAEEPVSPPPKLEGIAPAPAFKVDLPAGGFNQPANGSSERKSDVARLLAALLRQDTKAEQIKGMMPESGEHRRVLVCAQPAYRDSVARSLVENHYEVFVAADTTQAIERMREDHMNVIILDLEFDPVEQGTAFINREISLLRPDERRRVLFVHLSPAVRTGDAQAAFTSHVNLVINPSDIDNLPHVLEHTIRDFNHLYRDFNKALKAAEL